MGFAVCRGVVAYLLWGASRRGTWAYGPDAFTPVDAAPTLAWAGRMTPATVQVGHFPLSVHSASSAHEYLADDSYTRSSYAPRNVVMWPHIVMVAGV